MKSAIQAILVPRGAEYQSVYRGLNRSPASTLSIHPIPIGAKPLIQQLEELLETGNLHPSRTPQVLLTGLCGSLTPHYKVGDIVLYQKCIDEAHSSKSMVLTCDTALTAKIYQALGDRVSLVDGLTSDRVICSAIEKKHLGQTFAADVVDMEGIAALQRLNQAGITVAIVRVVSDDCHHDIPDLTAAIDAEGTLQSLPMALTLLRQPIAAMRLIQGSLKSLKVLQSVTTHLFTHLE